MRHARTKRARGPALTNVDAALATMSADELRDVVREVIRELDASARTRVVSALVEQAARGTSGWLPAAVTDAQLAEAITFVRAAVQVHHADPADVDEYLALGSRAFLGKDYTSAHRIFGALLPPLGDGDIHLGQDELVDEVLGADTGACAAQYVVSAYMLAPVNERAAAVRAAIRAVRGLGHFWEPLREMERVAIEPLPELEDFLPRWRVLIASPPADARGSTWDSREDRWRREVIARLEGPRGLAMNARSTRRAEDVRAWCSSVVATGDWRSALQAFGEAAALVADDVRLSAELFDGAAAAAQQLGLEDVPARLERAWRTAPSELRLRRWLGSSTSTATLREHVAAALDACPPEAVGQRALLHVLAGALTSAAGLLAEAPDLGWSSGDHPGRLLFPLFASMLGAPRPPAWSSSAAELDAPECVVAPPIEALVMRAEVDVAADPPVQATLLAAMRTAAERRLAAVTTHKRRRHYGHAAELVATCVACDATAESARWAVGLAAVYRGFPALRGELERALGEP